MWTKNFIKELVLKNDLTYLTLCLPYLVSLTLKPEGFGPFLTLIALFGILIFAWVLSCKKRYIFNTPVKILLPISCILFLIRFFENETLDVMANFLSIVFVGLFFCLLVMYTHKLYQNASEYYVGEYEPSLSDIYAEQFYLRSIYSIVDYNNTFKYFYDANIDVYVYNDNMYEQLPKNNKEPHKIVSVAEYVKFLQQNDLTPTTMTKENLTVLKMCII